MDRNEAKLIVTTMKVEGKSDADIVKMKNVALELINEYDLNHIQICDMVQLLVDEIPERIDWNSYLKYFFTDKILRPCVASWSHKYLHSAVQYAKQPSRVIMENMEYIRLDEFLRYTNNMSNEILGEAFKRCKFDRDDFESSSNVKIALCVWYGVDREAPINDELSPCQELFDLCNYMNDTLFNAKIDDWADRYDVKYKKKKSKRSNENRITKIVETTPSNCNNGYSDPFLIVKRVNHVIASDYSVSSIRKLILTINPKFKLSNISPAMIEAIKQDIKSNLFRNGIIKIEHYEIVL